MNSDQRQAFINRMRAKSQDGGFTEQNGRVMTPSVVNQLDEFSTHDIAEILHVSPPTIRRYMRLGILGHEVILVKSPRSNRTVHKYICRQRDLDKLYSDVKLIEDDLKRFYLRGLYQRSQGRPIR